MQTIARRDAKGDHCPDDTIMDSSLGIVHDLSSLEAAE